MVQLSINALKPAGYHLELGARLAPLRDRGVLIVGSGNVVHNLGRIDWHQPDGAFDWARRFDDAARAVMGDDPGAAAGLAGHPDFAAAAPTPDHFIPLLYLAGLAGAAGTTAEPFAEGYAYGSLSMTAYALDVSWPAAAEPEQGGDGPAGPLLPDPGTVPPDDTNA